jgi:transcriptional regulator with XRE-family HTH domain
MKMRFTNEWLRRRIERDADVDTEAGLPIIKIDVLNAFVPEKVRHQAPFPVAAGSAQPQPTVLFGRLLRQLRRRDNLQLPQLALEVRVPEPELRALEEGGGVALRPRTIHQLATFFKISPQALLALSPAAAERDPELDNAAVRFAASSDDLAKLSRDERKSLNEFVKLLSEYRGRPAHGKR